MVAYSFKARFVPPILAGIKAQTIRAERRGRSCHARPSEPMQLFSGQRTRHCRRLGTPRCESVSAILITFPRTHRRAAIEVERETGGFDRIHDAGLDAFARSDGFDDFADMLAFWTITHPDPVGFEGVLIRWQPLSAADPLIIAGAA